MNFPPAIKTLQDLTLFILSFSMFFFFFIYRTEGFQIHYEYTLPNVCVCVCVCVVIPSILDVSFVDVLAGVTQEGGHTGFLHLPSAVLALFFSRECFFTFL